MTALEHNRKLVRDFIGASKVHSRYPRVSEQAEAVPLDTSKFPSFAYNPSIGRDVTGRMWLTCRWHHAKDYTTRIGIAEVTGTGELLHGQMLALGEHSIEDARLFQLQGELWLSWVQSNFLGQKDPKCVVKYTKLERPHNEEPSKRHWQSSRVYQPNGGGNDGTGLQKNWVFFEAMNENLFCVWESSPRHIVFQMQGEAIVNEYVTPEITWPYGPIRGGNIIPWNRKLLRVFHSSTEHDFGGRTEKRYYIGSCLMESKPPFTVLRVSQRPILCGSELDALTPAQRSACFHFKPNVVFPCGLMQIGDNLVSAVGINDSTCSLVKIKPNV
jgi:hypothetical protein